jgi:hypothetical protein
LSLPNSATIDGITDETRVTNAKWFDTVIFVSVTPNWWTKTGNINTEEAPV